MFQLLLFHGNQVATVQFRFTTTLCPSLFQVPYHVFADAFSRARAEQKLVHAVVLWGALDDQSC